MFMERTAYFSVLAPVFKSLYKLKVAKMAISQLKLALSPSVAIYLGQWYLRIEQIRSKIA